MPSSFSHQHEAPPSTGGGVQIQDDTPSLTTAYSGQKIEDEIALLVTAADAPQLPETTDEHRVVLTTATEGTFEDGIRIYRETNNAINIGDHEESNRTTRDESICIGLSSGCLGNATHQKTCVGYQSARGTAGDQIVCVGVRSFQGSTGQRVTALGHYAMSQVNNGDDSVAVGNYAGQFSTALTDSVAIGNDSCRNLTSTGVQDSVHIGKLSGEASITTGTIAVGVEAGRGNTGDNCVLLGNQQGLNNTDNNRLMIGNEQAHAIIDGTMGIDFASCELLLNADSIRVGNSLPISYDAGNPRRLWISDNTLRLGNYVAPPAGPTETHGHFTKNSNTSFYSDGVINIRWDGLDEIHLRQDGLTGITDVYATAHVFTNAVSFPSSNPMLLTTIENDFTQRSSAHFVDFTIKSDSDGSFPYYKIHYEVASSTGTDLVYWNIKKYE